MSKPGSRLVVLLVTVYVVGGSTYLAIRVMVDTFPPLFSMGVRFTTAGLLLLAYVRVRRGPTASHVSRREAASCVVSGLLLLGIGSGVVAVAVQTVPSGLASVIVAVVPLWLVVLNLFGRKRVTPLSAAGTALGLVGVAIVANPFTLQDDVQMWGVLLLVGGTVAWALGMLVSASGALPDDTVVAAAWQLMAAGPVLLVASAGSGELARLHLASAPPEAWLSLLYITVMGSIVANVAALWLMQNVSLSLTATFAYVNPIVAVLLGWLLVHEVMSLQLVAGGAVVIVSVALVAAGERPRSVPVV